MEILDSMPEADRTTTQQWNEIADHLKAGKTVKLIEGTDFPVGKAGAVRATMYTRLGQRGIRVTTVFKEDALYVTQKSSNGQAN
jgi:hypothetical protein